jgi:hypothetical protein
MAGPPFFFSNTHTFNGIQTVPESIPGLGITPKNSNILVAAVELDSLGNPFIGGAAIQVMDIAPEQDGVSVRVNVLFDTPVTFRLAYVIWP